MRSLRVILALLFVSCCVDAALVPPSHLTGSSHSAEDAEKLQAEAESNMRQADATIDQVQADIKRMDTFGAEVKRNLAEEAKAKQDITHALGYFHRQLQVRDRAHAPRCSPRPAHFPPPTHAQLSSA